MIFGFSSRLFHNFELKVGCKIGSFCSCPTSCPCAPKHDMMIALQLPGATLVWIPDLDTIMHPFYKEHDKCYEL